MRRSRVLVWIGLTLTGAAFFVFWHSDLLTPAGRIRGIDSDAAIIGLMGKKMLEARGFDIFFWGQNYIGPLTSMLTAAWGAALGQAGPLALRLAVFTEVFAGIVLMAWAVAKIDARAAILTAVALILTPPVLLRMMETPLGAEMSFVLSAALLLVLVQHLTAGRGRGWLARSGGQFAFGVLAGVSWWMNQQVVFTLAAGAIVLAFRSRLATAVFRKLHIRDRLLLRGDAIRWTPMPGLAHALVWLASVSGWLLLAAWVVLDLAGLHQSLIVIDPIVDATILILGPQVILPIALGEWRHWRLHPLDPEQGTEIRALARVAAGSALGYAPVWIGALAGSYEHSYVFAFRPSRPSDVLRNLHVLAQSDAAHWIGLTDNLAGVLFAIALFLFVTHAALRAHTEARILLALVPLANVLFYLFAAGVRAHYLISSIGPLFAVAALGALSLWDAHRWAIRSVLAATAVIAFFSIGMAAARRHGELLASPDPMPLLERVRDANCAVCYAEYWTAYRYRFIDGEQRAWIPYLSQDRSYDESVAAQRLPGQRCLIVDGEVRKIDSDLPLKHRPPGVR